MIFAVLDRTNVTNLRRRQTNVDFRLLFELCFTCERIDTSSSIPSATARNDVPERRADRAESEADDRRQASRADCSDCR